MATIGLLNTARRILLALEASQSQGSLTSQAIDCAPIVEALGYYDLADHLRRLASPNTREASPNPSGRTT